MWPPEYQGLANLARRTRHEPTAVEILPGDVGRRRYVRLALSDGQCVLGVIYPPEETDSRLRWNAARTVLRERLRVPLLIADDQQGNQIVEDFGRTDIASLLVDGQEQRRTWLERAADAAAVLAETSDPGINPPFDPPFFRRELELAREAVFDLWLRKPLTADQRRAHDLWADALCTEISEHPRALCHRDYHGNNLFPAGRQVGAIDFQDLRSGPDAYDLASLLWERTTLQWMTADLADWILESFARSRGIDRDGLRARLDRVLLQRAWKVCGTFARAVAAGRADAYRRYLPAEIALVGRLLRREGPDRAFRQVFEDRLASVC